MKPILDFDDAGAADDHPARGVTVGDIRAWHDEIEQLRKTLDIALAEHDDAGGQFATDYMPEHWTHCARRLLTAGQRQNEGGA